MEKRSKRTASIQNDTTTDDTADQATTAALAAQQVAFQSIVDGQLKAFQACMQACMEANNKRFDDFVRVTICDISELKASLQFTHKELREVKQSVNVNNDGNIAADKLLAKLTDDIKRVDDAADYMENQSRRNNLRVDGVKEKPGETWQETETALRQVVQRELKLPADQVGALQIERAQGFFFNEDFSQRVISRRKELLQDMREARERGKIAYLSLDKLVVNHFATCCKNNDRSGGNPVHTPAHRSTKRRDQNINHVQNNKDIEYIIHTERWQPGGKVITHEC